MARYWLGLLALMMGLNGCQALSLSAPPAGQLVFRWSMPAGSLKLAAIPEQTRFFQLSIRGEGLSRPFETELDARLPASRSYRLPLPVGPKEVTVLAYDDAKALSRARISVDIRPAQLTQVEMELQSILHSLLLDFQSVWPLPLELELELTGQAFRGGTPRRFSLLLPVGQTQLSLPEIPAQEGVLRLRVRPQGQSIWGAWLTQALPETLPLRSTFLAVSLLESWQAFVPEWLPQQSEGAQVQILALMGSPQLQRLLSLPQFSPALRALIQAELERKRSAGNSNQSPTGVPGGSAQPQASTAPAPQLSPVPSPQVAPSSQPTPSPVVSPSPSGVPASPLAFYLAEAGDSYLRLAWEPVSGAAAYSLSLNGQLLSNSLTFAGYSLSGLSPQTTYHFLLRARNQAGESGAVTLVAQTLAAGARTTGGGSDPVTAPTPLPAPVLESVSPLQAQIGSRLVLRGQHFYPPVQVTFDGAYPASVVSLTEHEIQVEIPALARQGQIQVNTASGSFATAIEIQTGAVQLEGGYH